MHSPFLIEMAQEKMRSALDAARTPIVPASERRTGFSRWVRSLALRRPAAAAQARGGTLEPLRDPAFRS